MEPATHCGANGKAVSHLEDSVQLEDGCVAGILVVLVADGDAGAEPLRQVAFEADVNAIAALAVGARIGRARAAVAARRRSVDVRECSGIGIHARTRRRLLTKSGCGVA